jgi:hypothetical protein
MPLIGQAAASWLQAVAAAALQPGQFGSANPSTRFSQPESLRSPYHVEREATVQQVVNALGTNAHISAAEASRYMDLWRQLDTYRQEAAEALFIEATHKQAPQVAARHVREVLHQNVAL